MRCKKRLKQKLRPRFFVLEPLNPVLRVLAEKGLEGRQQLAHVQATLGIYIPRRFLLKFLLYHPRQFARHYLGVDRIGHAQRDDPEQANPNPVRTPNRDRQSGVVRRR